MNYPRNTIRIWIGLAWTALAAGQQVGPPLLGLAAERGRLGRLEGIPGSTGWSGIQEAEGDVLAVNSRASTALLRNSESGELTLVRLKEGHFHREVVPLPAPELAEFSPSGDAAIVSAGGRLFRVDLGTAGVEAAIGVVALDAIEAKGTAFRIADGGRRALALVRGPNEELDLYLWDADSGWFLQSVAERIVSVRFHPRTGRWIAVTRARDEVSVVDEDGRVAVLSKEWRPKHHIRDFAVDGAGRLWILTTPGLLFGWDADRIPVGRWECPGGAHRMDLLDQQIIVLGGAQGPACLMDSSATPRLVKLFVGEGEPR